MTWRNVLWDILHYTARCGHHSVANEEDHSLLSKEVKKSLGRCYGLNVCVSSGAGGPQ